jgi:hypothetical protein
MALAETIIVAVKKPYDFCLEIVTLHGGLEYI